MERHDLTSNTPIGHDHDHTCIDPRQSSQKGWVDRGPDPSVQLRRTQLHCLRATACRSRPCGDDSGLAGVDPARQRPCRGESIWSCPGGGSGSVCLFCRDHVSFNCYRLFSSALEGSLDSVLDSGSQATYLCGAVAVQGWAPNAVQSPAQAREDLIAKPVASACGRS